MLGELAPKRLALQRVERVALFSAPILDRIASLARPLVWLLSKSTNLVVTIVGGDPRAGRKVMTEEELRDLVAEQPGAQPGRAGDRGGRLRRGETPAPRGAAAADRGGVRRPPTSRCSEAAQLAVSVPYSRLPGLPGLLRQRDRLRSHPGPARPGLRAPARSPWGRSPAGEVPADQQDRAVRPVGDAPRTGAPGDRGRRVRRHRRHRHAGGPGRGADRRHPRRVRRRRRPAAAAARRRGRGRRPAQPGRVRRADRASTCPRARTRRRPATCSPASARCPRWARQWRWRNTG